MSLPATVTQETRAIRPFRKFEGHTGTVSGVVYLPGGQRIISSSLDASLRVWDLQSGKQIGIDWRDDESAVETIGLSPDGMKVVNGTNDGAVILWDVDTGKVIAKWTGHTSDAKPVCWSQDGGRVVSGSSDGTARVWDVESGKTVLAIETGLNNVWAVTYSPDTTMVATGGYNKDNEFLRVWDANTGKLIANLEGVIVFCLAWTPDGKTLISGSSGSLIRMWNTTTWQQIGVLTGHTDVVYNTAVSPNSRILASASWDKTARLWNLENSQPIGLPFQHDNSVYCVSFSTDGKLLATGCKDNNAYSWDIFSIAKEAGFSELLNLSDKPDAGATRRRGDWRRNPYPGPSNDTPHHPHLAGRHILSPSSAHISAHISSHQHAPPGRISSPSRRNNYNTGDIPTQLRFLQWAINPFFNIRNSRIDEGVELRERRTDVVDVPLGQARPRYYTARQVQMEKEKARNAREAEKQKARETKKASASSSRPSQCNVNPQPGEEAQTQPTLGLHSADLPTSSTSAIAATSAFTTRWARFWLAACCISAQNANDDH